ncbi:hypothetical protein PVAND_008314 [Polypedilum vanderplanki]|uniref:Uncharacterized protein n=1 Tax=Polypedilum vanderplanki TaxID=319348 RepID=A0A9J6CA71_POLVA|nr:hypothetical protein PVAND_008314 [Polypedilum vanderplanki]
MEFSRKVIIFTTIYSAIQAVIYILLSILSMLSYLCVIESVYTLTPSLYMMHLYYFKSPLCKSDVNWEHLGLQNVSGVKMLRRSYESSAVDRTLIISLFYLLFNCALLASSVIMYWKINLISRNQLAAGIVLTSPFFISSTLIYSLDIISAAYYSIDYTRAYTVDGAMTVLEVKNRHEILPLLDQLDPRILTFGPALMMYTALKFLIFFTLNTLVMVFAVPSMRDNLRANRRRTMETERRLIWSTSVPVMT